MFRVFAASAAAVVLLTVARAETPKAVELFNGKDLTGWKTKGDAKRSKWVAASVRIDPRNPSALTDAAPPTANAPQIALANLKSGSVDLYTEAKYGDITLELEFMIPKGSNSGVYLMGEYEVQILDSFGKEKVGPGDLGGLYTAAAPKVNAAKKPGEWQKFVIVFQAPKFHADKKVANAKFVKVTLNDTVIHENVEMKGATPGGLTGKESATGPLLLQGDHGAVAFRNITVTPAAK